MIRGITLIVLLGLALSLEAAPITYQGQLEQSGTPFSGSQDMQFRLFDAPIGGNEVAPLVVVNDVQISQGQFQVELDFGPGVFDGQSRYLQVHVGGSTLSPRQRVGASPVALFALTGNEGPPGPQGAQGPFGRRSAMVGGQSNSLTSAEDSLIAGGANHLITNTGWSFIGGGTNNRIEAGFGNFIAGGRENLTDGNYTFIAAGSNNRAEGLNSFAAGNRAKAVWSGSFVWADNTDEDFSASGNNQFLIRANGGVGINAAPDDAALTIRAASSTANLLDVQVRQASLDFSPLRVTNSGFVSVALSSPSGAEEPVCRIQSNGNLSICTDAFSTIEMKQNISTLDDQAKRLAQLRPVSFEWKSGGAPGIGLIAEEVAEFIPEIVRYDREGNIQGLHYQKLAPILIAAFQEKSAASAERFAALGSENTELRAAVAVLTVQSGQMRELANRNAELEQRMAALESVLLEGRRLVHGAAH